MHTRLCLIGANLVSNPNVKHSNTRRNRERTIPNRAQSYQPGEAMCRCAPDLLLWSGRAEQSGEERRGEGAFNYGALVLPGSVGKVKVSINFGGVSCATAASEIRAVGLRRKRLRGPVSGGLVDGQGPIPTSLGFKTEERGK